MARSALRHVSVRVPWHDTGWNGRICADPAGNSACLAVRRTAQNRDDEYEASCAGASLDDLDRMPPCLSERGTFLSPRQFTHVSKLDYSNYSKDHEHVLPASINIPAYGGVLTPFRWMLREHAWQITEELGLEAQASREPEEGRRHLGRGVEVAERTGGFAGAGRGAALDDRRKSASGAFALTVPSATLLRPKAAWAGYRSIGSQASGSADHLAKPRGYPCRSLIT